MVYGTYLPTLMEAAIFESAPHAAPPAAPAAKERLPVLVVEVGSRRGHQLTKACAEHIGNEHDARNTAMVWCLFALSVCYAELDCRQSVRAFSLCPPVCEIYHMTVVIVGTSARLLHEACIPWINN
jgi:hypothetical protein